MKSHIEKSKRRRKLYGKMKFIFAGIFFFLGVPALVITYALIRHATEPLYVSPLPFINDIQVSASTADDDTIKNRIGAELQRQHVTYTRIDTSGQNTYSIQLPDGGVVFVTKNKDITVQIASLQVIYNRLTMEGKRFKKLDVRFSKPVITF